MEFIFTLQVLTKGKKGQKSNSGLSHRGEISYHYAIQPQGLNIVTIKRHSGNQKLHLIDTVCVLIPSVRKYREEEKNPSGALKES